MEYLAVIYAVSLLVVMLAFLELGRRYGLKHESEGSESGTTGKRIVEGAFFGLLSLLIAFSFSGAVSRFDSRRGLIIQEANVIATTYVRVDLMSSDAQPRMRELFRNYLDSRLAIYDALPDIEAARSELAHSADLQGQIWSLAIAVTREPGSHPDCGKLLLPSINSMAEIANSRTWAALTHPPSIIYGLLFVIALICSFIAGSSLAGARSKSWTHVLGFALLTCASVYVILEIEYPRVGFINIEKYDHALVDVRQNMK